MSYENNPIQVNLSFVSQRINSSGDESVEIEPGPERGGHSAGSVRGWACDDCWSYRVFCKQGSPEFPHVWCGGTAEPSVACEGGVEAVEKDDEWYGGVGLVAFSWDESSSGPGTIAALDRSTGERVSCRKRFEDGLSGN